MAEDISIFQEIDESLRVEKLEQFWQRFGNWVIAGCAGIVLLTIASVVWKSHLHDVNMKKTDTVLHALSLQQAGKTEEANQLLADVANGNHGIATIARLNQADALVKSGDIDKARALYSDIAHDHKNDESLRDFAALQAFILADNQHNTPEPTQAGSTGHPFANTFNEIIAARLLQDGKTKEAAALLKPIAEDNAVTTSERARAMEMLDSISGSNP